MGNAKVAFLKAEREGRRLYDPAIVNICRAAPLSGVINYP